MGPKRFAFSLCLFSFLRIAVGSKISEKVQKRAELNKFESTLEKALCHAPGCRRGSRALEMLTLQRQARACTSPFVHSCKKHTVKGALTPTGDTSQHLIRLPRAALQFQRTALTNYEMPTWYTYHVARIGDANNTQLLRRGGS